MRPIHGLVIKVKHSSLVVKLETGVVREFNKVAGLNIYDKCLVGYDFTTMKYGHVWPEKKEYDCMVDKEIDIIDIEPAEPFEEALEVEIEIGSGALRQEGEGERLGVPDFSDIIHLLL